MFADLDPDAVLRQRDDFFDATWIRAAEPVQIAWENAAKLNGGETVIARVRDAAFDRVIELSGGDEDLAGTVADDFEIICKQIVTGVPSPFIAKLREKYDRNQIPC